MVSSLCRATHTACCFFLTLQALLDQDDPALATPDALLSNDKGPDTHGIRCMGVVQQFEMTCYSAYSAAAYCNSIPRVNTLSMPHHFWHCSLKHHGDTYSSLKAARGNTNPFKVGHSTLRCLEPACWRIMHDDAAAENLMNALLSSR